MTSLFDEAFAPYQQGGNVLQALNFQDPGPIGIPMQNVGPIDVPEVRAPRERTSLLDILGRVGDTLAIAGEGEPIYQQSLDARADRQRQTEMDAIRKRISEQTIAQNDQTLGNNGREQLGQVLGGIIGSENPADEFERIAEIAGIPEAQRAQIRQTIAQGVDPERLARAFGYAPQRQGSPSAIESEYALRAATLGQEAADEWLRTEGQSTAAPKRRTYSVNAGDRIEEYDIETGGLVRSIPVGARPGGTDRGGLSLTPGQKKVDEAFAKDFAQYEAAGGFADVEKSIQQLREARAALEEGGLTGGITGYIPTWAGRTVVNPRSVAVQQQVEEVVQRNLRLILGAQFTQKEGERLIERSFDPKLSEAENIAKLDRIIQQIETAARTKEEAGQYFAQNGTLQGWRGRLPAGTQAPSGGGRSAPAGNRAAPPQPGTVRNGWRFNGGNPVDRSNWTKVP